MESKDRHQATISDEQLRAVAGQAKPTMTYAVLMSMSGVLAAVALLTDSVPILVGSMVIAPALSPLGLVAFATVRGNVRLVLQGLSVSAMGFVLAIIFAMLTTYTLTVTEILPDELVLLERPLLHERLNPGWYSVVAAASAGVAGSLALTKDRTDTLVGTVAALALVPAAGAAAIAFLSGFQRQAIDGLTLLGINAGLVIGMGIVTLLIARPGRNQ